MFVKNKIQSWVEQTKKWLTMSSCRSAAPDTPLPPGSTARPEMEILAAWTGEERARKKTRATRVSLFTVESP